MNNKTAFPLSWPDGWPRTKSPTWSQFGRQRRGGLGRGHSMAKVFDELQLQLDRLGAKELILSTNVKLKLNGEPYANLGQPIDKGAAVYFKLKGKDVVLACDRWDRVECNIWAIASHIDALRGQQRWGVGNIEQAFRGYTALPERATSSWWEILGVPINAGADQVKEAYRTLVKKHHPDAGGEAELFRRVQGAWEEFAKLTK